MDQELYNSMVDLYDKLYDILGEPIVSTVAKRKETIMSPDSDNLDPDLAQLNADDPEADELEYTHPDNLDEFNKDEGDEKAEVTTPTEADIEAHIDALTDSPQTEAMEDQDRQADLDQCCGTDPTLGQEQTGKGVFKPIFEKDQDTIDPDRKRVTQLPKHPDQTIPGNRSPAREEVYKLLDGEREYQRIRCSNHLIDDSKWSPNDWLVFIEQYLYDARELTGNHGLQMDEIRKIGGLVVAAMEHIPTPSRV